MYEVLRSDWEALWIFLGLSWLRCSIVLELATVFVMVELVLTQLDHGAGEQGLYVRVSAPTLAGEKLAPNATCGYIQ